MWSEPSAAPKRHQRYCEHGNSSRTRREDRRVANGASRHRQHLLTKAMYLYGTHTAPARVDKALFEGAKTLLHSKASYHGCQEGNPQPWCQSFRLDPPEPRLLKLANRRCTTNCSAKPLSANITAVSCLFISTRSRRVELVRACATATMSQYTGPASYGRRAQSLMAKRDQQEKDRLEQERLLELETNAKAKVHDKVRRDKHGRPRGQATMVLLFVGSWYSR